MRRSPPAAARFAAALAVAALAGGCGRGDLDSPIPERRAAAVRRVASRGGRGDLPVLLVAQRDSSALVRRAAAEAFAARGGPGAAEALGALLGDPDPDVVGIAAAGLASMGKEPRTKEVLLAGYGRASPAGRAQIAEALARIGTSLREAVEVEARTLWERNLAALGSSRGEARAGAAEEIGASARAEAVLRLLPLADPNRNPDPALLAAAAAGLGEAGDWSARPHLEALLSEHEVGVAEAAVAALGRLGDPSAADALAAAASSGPARLAAAAVDALSALPQAPEVGLALCEVAGRTVDPAVSSRAARQARLREAECPEKIFIGRLGRGQDAAVLAALAELGLQGDAARAAAEKIQALLEAGRFETALRPAAARTLGRLGRPEAAPALVKRAGALLQRFADLRIRWILGPLPQTPAPGFEGGGEARVAAVVAHAPGLAPGDPARAGPAEWIDRVPAADARELGALLAAAGRLRADGASALLAPLVHDPLAPVRAGAVEGLAFAAPEEALPALTGALEDPAAEVRLASARALPRLGARAVPALAAAVRRAGPPDPEWLVELATALGETGAAEAVPALADLLDGDAAPAAAAALARIGVPAGAAPLAHLLVRPSAVARADVIDALAQLASPEGGPAIAAQLTSDRPEVRAAAARALGRLRFEAASERLEALRSDYYGRVRRAAVDALAKLPSGARRARP
ncbi:MAG TPA: HEAT repeat domain-containing protein [Anaeromyxobacteraceae bacterium]|nr:HEAT repeat domain-containing protein [Anaeromyxobacteraceae bacterium]